jgi:hypothetical protein
MIYTLYVTITSMLFPEAEKYKVPPFCPMAA